MSEISHPKTAVIMAGGLGLRLRPLTLEVPKPLLPLKERPLLDFTVRNLVEHGFSSIIMCVKYHADQFRDHFGTGERFGANITFVEEPEEPLGTAGPLRLIREMVREPFLLINGDILTSLNFSSFWSFHLEKEPMLTIGIKEKARSLPYGVIESREGRVLGIEEKPAVKHQVNAGIYLLEPEVLDLIPERGSYDLPDLILELLSAHLPIAAYHINEFWLDVGTLEDYQIAQKWLESDGIEPFE